VSRTFGASGGSVAATATAGASDDGGAPAGLAGPAAGSPGLGDVTALGTTACGTGRARVNHQAPPATTTATAATVRAIAAGPDRDAGSPFVTGDDDGGLAEPHLHVVTLFGTRRLHCGHTQLVPAGSRSPIDQVFGWGLPGT